MSDIPYITRLGDALETAVTTTAAAPRRPRRRRVWLLAVGGALVVSASAGAAGLLSGSQEQAANSIACYASAPPERSESITVVFAVDRSPVDTCAAELRRIGQDPTPLVACSDRESVAVIPGRRSADCTRNGLRPLVAGYEPARARIARLERDVVRLEARLGCVAPSELASRVQALLDRGDWTGWKTRILPPQPGSWQPCAAVSTAGGGQGRSLAGALEVQTRYVVVQHDIPRALFELLYGAGGLAPRLEDHSGSACFTAAQLVAHADRELAPSKLRAQVVTPPALPAGARGGRFADARQARYEAGCAIVVDVRSGDRAGIIALEIAQKP